MTTNQLITQLQQMVLEGHGDEEVIVTGWDQTIVWPRAVDHKGQCVRILTQGGVE